MSSIASTSFSGHSANLARAAEFMASRNKENQMAAQSQSEQAKQAAWAQSCQQAKQPLITENKAQEQVATGSISTYA